MVTGVVGVGAVLLVAWERNEVVRAADFAREHGLAGAICGVPLASDPEVVSAISKSGLGVVLWPYVPGQSRRSLESMKTLVAAKIPVGFALDAPTHHPDGLRLSAALAIAADDPVARQAVADFIDRLGYDPVDAGPLRAARNFGAGTPIFGASLARDELVGLLGAASESATQSRLTPPPEPCPT